MNKLHFSLLLSVFCSASVMASDQQFGFKANYTEAENSPPLIYVSIIDKNLANTEAKIPKQLSEYIVDTFLGKVVDSEDLAMRFDHEVFQYTNYNQIRIYRRAETSVNNDYLTEPMIASFLRCWSSLPKSEDLTVTAKLLDDNVPFPKQEAQQRAIIAAAHRISTLMLNNYQNTGCEDGEAAEILYRSDAREAVQLFTVGKLIKQTREVAIENALYPLFWGKQGLWHKMARYELKELSLMLVSQMTVNAAELEDIELKKKTFIDWTNDVRGSKLYSQLWLKSIGISCLKDVDSVFKEFDFNQCVEDNKATIFEFNLGSVSSYIPIGGQVDEKQ